MKLFFTASHSGKKNYQHSYDEIVRILQAGKHDVMGLEVQTYKDLLGDKVIEHIKNTSEDEQDAKYRIHYAYTRKAIDRANAVIIEASTEKFMIGYEARMALDFKKPILCLSKHKDFSLKVRDPKFYAYKYEEISELEGVVKGFIKHVKNKLLSVRIHINLLPEDYNFLEWFSKNNRINKSRLIRDLIRTKKEKLEGYHDDIARFVPK